MMLPTAAMILLVVACGGGDNGDGSASDATTRNEDELARSMLLTVADFPSGWSEAPDDEEESPFDKCKPGDPEGRTGRAETGDFSRGGQPSVSEAVAIFETPEQVQSSLDRFSELGDCLTRVVDDGDLDTDEAEYSDATFGELSFRQFGDRTDAYRLKIHVKSKQGTGLGSEGDLFLDVVSVMNGRVGFSFNATDAFSPFDTEELEDIVSKAHAKVEDLLAESGQTGGGPSRTTSPSRSTAATVRPTRTAEAPSTFAIGQRVETKGHPDITVLDFYRSTDPTQVFEPALQGQWVVLEPGEEYLVVTLRVTNDEGVPAGIGRYWVTLLSRGKEIINALYPVFGVDGALEADVLPVGAETEGRIAWTTKQGFDQIQVLYRPDSGDGGEYLITVE